eukprot:TRINITY_DN9345_c0_g1_i3.p1 TRINITY_DN9345_c0_g1~~TRINITY_DN9345_c0_g1_i3.p1  ORF type:complete len:120 (+),score=2.10 TRINITY_DN9345_c0_g1_i3:565-924(+)
MRCNLKLTNVARTAVDSPLTSTTFDVSKKKNLSLFRSPLYSRSSAFLKQYKKNGWLPIEGLIDFILPSHDCYPPPAQSRGHLNKLGNLLIALLNLLLNLSTVFILMMMTGRAAPPCTLR